MAPILPPNMDVTRPDYPHEDITVVQGVRHITALLKQLLMVVRSGPVEDTLASILSRLVSLQRKFDTYTQKQEEENADSETQLPGF